MTLGEKITKHRKELNYTQEQLAEILGVSRQSISKWESDIAYPETEKLIKLGKIFSCSMDYLLNDEITQRNHSDTASEAMAFIKDASASLKRQFRERKSERIVWGMPLYHIGRNAHGFLAVGVNARGFIAIGMKAKGVVSLGLLSMGVLSIGLLSLGLLSMGVFSLGLLSAGSIALGLVAAGAISVGVLSFGALSVGCFSAGALAVGQYAAVGDTARAAIAIGESEAVGTVYQHIGDVSTADMGQIKQWLDANVPAWLGWAKAIFQFFMGA